MQNSSFEYHQKFSFHWQWNKNKMQNVSFESICCFPWICTLYCCESFPWKQFLWILVIKTIYLSLLHVSGNLPGSFQLINLLILAQYKFTEFMQDGHSQWSFLWNFSFIVSWAYGRPCRTLFFFLYLSKWGHVCRTCMTSRPVGPPHRCHTHSFWSLHSTRFPRFLRQMNYLESTLDNAGGFLYRGPVYSS